MKITPGVSTELHELKRIVSRWKRTQGHHDVLRRVARQIRQLAPALGIADDEDLCALVSHCAQYTDA